MITGGNNQRGQRLAYLFSRYPVVSHTFVDNEILALEARGWDLVIASLSPPKNDFRHSRLNQLLAPVVYSPPTFIQKACNPPADLLAEFRQQFGTALEPEKCLRNALPLAARLQQMGVSHIHVHFANRATYAALFIKRLTGITYSFTPQAADFLVDLDSPELLAAMCREAKFVIAPCDFAAIKLAELCPDSEDKIHRVYNGIDPTPYLQANPQPEPGKMRIVSVGRLVEFKGFHHVIEAVALARKNSLEVDFFLQGDGPWRERLETLADDLKVADLIHFEGTVSIDEMRTRFATVDAFALACTTDQRGATDMLPTVITEAMLSCLPVISCPVAGVPEQVQHNHTGLLVESNNPEQLAGALLQLAKSPGMAAAMGKAGHQFASEKFSIAATLPGLETHLETVPQKKIATKQQLGVLIDLNDPHVDRRTRELELLAFSKTKAIDVWIAATRPQLRDPAAQRLAGCNWLPDGMVLEMEWQQQQEMRSQIESLRNALGDAIDGEDFLEYARRAIWLAIQLPRLYSQRAVLAMDSQSLLTAWLTSELINLDYYAPSALLKRFPSKIRQRITQSVTELRPTRWRNWPGFLPSFVFQKAVKIWLQRTQLSNDSQI